MLSFGSLFSVSRIKGGEGRDFIRTHHYSHSCHNGPMCWGLHKAPSNELVGVCAFATPCSENVRRSVFGAEGVDRVSELHRLVILDEVRRSNLTSWFVSRCLRGLIEERPDLDVLISFADATEGHVGFIYQSLNAQYCGTTGKAWFYRDQEGRLRHPRQNGVNISKKKAEERGWTRERRDAKHRYLLVLPHPPARRRRVRREILLPCLPYPKKNRRS